MAGTPQRPMDDDQAPSAAISEVLQQHRAVHHLVGELRAATDLRDALRCLETLDAFLARHFEAEQAPDGFYDTILNTAPFFERRAKALIDDHGRVSTDIAGVCERVRELLDGPMADIFRDIDALSRRIIEHESGENQLLSDALYNELGGQG